MWVSVEVIPCASACSVNYKTAAACVKGEYPSKYTELMTRNICYSLFISLTYIRIIGMGNKKAGFEIEKQGLKRCQSNGKLFPTLSCLEWRMGICSDVNCFIFKKCERRNPSILKL